MSSAKVLCARVDKLMGGTPIVTRLLIYSRSFSTTRAIENR